MSPARLACLPAPTPRPPLQVRKDQPQIDMGILTEAMDKTRLGLPRQALPESAAKRQYAAIEAAR